MLNAQEILEKKFEKSAFGYRSDEVDDYLQELSVAFDKLQNEKIQMERKLEVLAEKIEEYRADEDNMRAAILDARKLGSSIVKDAQRQADKMNLSHLQKEVATFKNQLLALYKNHLELISSLPENTKPEESAPSGQKEKASAEQEVYPKEEKMPDLEDETISIQEESAVPEEEPVAEERESRFGPLKFGAGYDLKRDR